MVASTALSGKEPREASASAPKQRVARLIAAAVLVGLAPGCGEPNAYVEPPPPEVTVATPVRRDVTDYFEATGTTQPILSVDIRARVKGFLKERHFKEGALVKEGQLLLVIDEEPFQLTLEQAKTRLAEADASLKKARQSRERETAKAQLELDQAQFTLTKISESRQRNLMARGAGTAEERDQAEAARKKAEAQVDADRAHLDQALADYETNILAAEAGVGAARTAVRNAEIELGYCRMRSPIDGRISRVNYHVGNLVGDGQASLLATVVKTDPIYAYTTVSEYDLLHFRRESSPASASSADAPSALMEMALAGESGFPHDGRLDYQDPALDPGTGTVQVRGVFPNPDGAILPGLFVRLRVPGGQRKGALLVPERALGTDQSGQYVLVVGENDVVEYRPVKAGALLNDLRVVEGKIGPHDRVVVEGLLRARPKLKVRPKADTSAQESVAATDAPRPR
jgi:membrane fusion protein (multidrug efflux system)